VIRLTTKLHDDDDDDDDDETCNKIDPFRLRVVL
jgi:hypothetical protein